MQSTYVDAHTNTMATAAADFVSFIESSNTAAAIYEKLLELTQACATHSQEAVEVFNDSLVSMVNHVISIGRDRFSEELVVSGTSPTQADRCNNKRGFEGQDDLVCKHQKSEHVSAFKRSLEGGYEPVQKHRRYSDTLGHTTSTSAFKRGLDLNDVYENVYEDGDEDEDGEVNDNNPTKKWRGS